MKSLQSIQSLRTPNNKKPLFATAVFLVSLFGAVSFQLLINPPSAVAGTDTYPAPWRPPAAQDSILDTWREWNRECTSYVAWMLHSVNGFEMPFHDDAVNWGTDAQNLSYPVNMTPAVGSIYWSTSADHVAYVEAVNLSAGTITTEDYNSGYPSNPGYWAEHTNVPINSASGYIHFKDTASNHSKPASITRDSSDMDVFYRDTGNNLENIGWNSSSGWGSPVGRGLTCGVGGNPCVNGNPAAVARDSSDMDVFYPDSSGNIENTGWNSGTGWNSTVARASGIVGDPTVISRSSTSMDVFYRDSSGNLKNVGWNSSTGWSSSTTRVTCGGTTPCVAGNPVAVARDSTDMDVFFRDAAGNLQDVGWNSSTGWGSPVYRAGSVSGDPAVISRDSVDMDVFYRDTNNNLLNVGWNSTSGWSSPTGRGLTCGVGGNPCVNGNPAANDRDSSDMDVFYPDSSSNLENTAGTLALAGTQQHQEQTAL